MPCQQRKTRSPDLNLQFCCDHNFHWHWCSLLFEEAFCLHLRSALALFSMIQNDCERFPCSFLSFTFDFTFQLFANVDISLHHEISGYRFIFADSDMLDHNWTQRRHSSFDWLSCDQSYDEVIKIMCIDHMIISSMVLYSRG